jgi:hypothetical protein
MQKDTFLGYGLRMKDVDLGTSWGMEDIRAAPEGSIIVLHGGERQAGSCQLASLAVMCRVCAQPHRHRPHQGAVGADSGPLH